MDISDTSSHYQNGTPHITLCVLFFKRFAAFLQISYGSRFVVSERTQRAQHFQKGINSLQSSE